MMPRIFKVNDTDLNDIDNFTVRKILHQNLPALQINAGNTATTDGGVATNVYKREKTIVVEGEFTSSDIDEFTINYQSLMSTILGVNNTLKFVVDGHNINYTGTLENISQSEPMGGYMDVKLAFRCYDPIGVSDGYFTNTDAGVTSVVNTTNLTIGGNYYAKPVITVHINSLTVTNPASMIIGSDAGSLIITREWTAGETVVVDAENNTVKVNDTLVVYSGLLPQLNAGSTSMTYDDGFTARNVDITIRYKKRYI